MQAIIDMYEEKNAVQEKHLQNQQTKIASLESWVKKLDQERSAKEASLGEV